MGIRKPPDPSRAEEIAAKKRAFLLDGDEGKGTASYSLMLDLRAQQIARARKPRPNCLNEIIEQYLQKNPAASTERVLSHLKSYPIKESIADVTDSEISYVHREHLKSAKISALPSRIARIRKKISFR